jgi:endoglucanase
VDDFSTWGLTDAWYDVQVGNPDPTLLTRFVVDTSRDGQGRWIPPAGKYTGDPLDWCNPPGRGLGFRATTGTRSPLADAFLFDPAAGQWFPQQALELARLASPPLF